MLLPDSILLAHSLSTSTALHSNTSAIVAAHSSHPGWTNASVGHLPHHKLSLSLIPRLLTQWGLGMRL